MDGTTALAGLGSLFGSVLGLFGSALGSIVVPKTVSQLGFFYLFWILSFSAINIVWDVRTPRTPPFHIHRLTDKISVLHNAAAFSSSLLIIIGVVSPDVAHLAQDTMVPMILAAAGGMMLSLPAICPYPASSLLLPQPAATGTTTGTG